MLECIRHVDGGWGIWTLTLAAARAQVYNEIFALGATYSFFIWSKKRNTRNSVHPNNQVIIYYPSIFFICRLLWIRINCLTL